MESKVFRGGVPYAIDVRRLIEAFPAPSLAEGRVIGHAQLEEISNSSKGSQRYYGVVNSWIAHMRNENGIFIIWEPATGIKILGPAEILTYTETKTRQKIKQTGRAIKMVNWVDRGRLDTIGQQRHDHFRRHTSMLMDSLAATRRELAVNLSPIASLPKPKLIREA
jgi:hypothetical protein